VLVELAGLPGAGKSTVFERLMERDASLAPMPILRRGPHRWTLARALARTTAMLAARRALDRSWDRDLVVMAAYLDALAPALADRSATIVFDQGPLYTLCRPQLRHPRLAGWRRAQLTRWAARLDLVVWLDAADDVLLSRIDARAKDHRLKGAGAQDAAAALAQDRAVLQDAVGFVAAAPAAPRILRVDTGAVGADAAAGEILQAIRTP
jgi:adenylate kinase family enzyme